MTSLFSSQSWRRWYRNRKYQYYKSQISDVGEDKKVKPGCLNMGGLLVINAYVNINRIAIEQSEEQKKKYMAFREAHLQKHKLNEGKKQKLVDNYSITVRKIMNGWSKTDKDKRAQQAADLRTSAGWRMFMRKFNEFQDTMNREERAAQLLDTQITKTNNEIERLTEINKRIEIGIEEGFDMAAHLNSILPILEGTVRTEIADSTSAGIRVDTTLAVLRQREEANMGLDSESPASTEADNKNFIEMLKLLGGNSNSQSSSSREKNKDSNQDIQYSSADQQDYEDDAEDDEDDVIFSNVKAQTASLLKKHEPKNKRLFAVDNNF